MNGDHLLQEQQQQQQRQMNSGLMRYRSAPSSLIANFVDGFSETEGCDEFLPHRSSSPEAERMFARYMSGGNSYSSSPNLTEKSQFLGAIEHHKEIGPQLMYQASSPPLMATHGLPISSSVAESSYRVMNSTSIDHSAQMKIASGGNCSNLIRQSSSPAGIFSHLSVANGYGVMRGMSHFGVGNGTNGEVDGSSSRLKGRRHFSPGPPSSSGLMSQISEIGNECVGPSSPDDGSLGNGNGSNRYIPGFPIGSWDDSSNDNFTGLKRVGDINNKMISASNPLETQNGEAGNHTPGLTHHFSLPKTSGEMATIKTFLQFQDSVPCKIRAKRGCATHPRSIAERVRRTRISERMRKLQELVPNMDKQTNTADMLNLALEYIKDLQKQVKTLSDKRANCTCSSKPKPYSKPTI